MAIKKDTLDQLLDGRDPKAIFSRDGLFDELKKTLAERVLNAELNDHLDNEAAEGSRKRLFRAGDAEAGRKALQAFQDGSWGRKYAAIGQIWRRQ